MNEETIEAGVRYSVRTISYAVFWYKFGTDILHRENGPAIEYNNGTKVWCKNGIIHREDGPACEYANGNKEYWLNDKYLEHINSYEELIIKVLLE